MSDAPERIWAYAGSFKMWRDHKTDRPHTQTEYVRADRIEELEANINIKADFIDATINQLAASDQRIDELKAKLAKAVEFIEDLTGCEWPYCEDAKRVLAELKGQDDE